MKPDEEDIPDEFSEAEQTLHLRNQFKKLDLEKQFGAHFSEGDSVVPPDIEAQWLEQIEEFERQYQNAGRTTVRAFIGNPQWEPLTAISPEKLKEAIDAVEACFAANNIVVDFLCDVPDKEIYRFLTEELPEEEMDDMHIPGMTQHYIYEEFHPNDEYDLKHSAEHFLSGLFYLDMDLVSHLFAKKGLRDAENQPITNKRMKQAFFDFRNSFISFQRPKLKVLSCTIDGDRASVSIRTKWVGVMDNSSPPIKRSGISTLQFIRNEFEDWDIVQAIVPGWNT
jgi:hypothetical protein